MNTKIKILIGILLKKISTPLGILLIVLAALLVTVLAWQCWLAEYGVLPIEISKPAKQVTITTDKTEYEQGESVRIVIQNKGGKPIIVCAESACTMVGSFPTQIEKYEGNKWLKKFKTCPVVTPWRLDMVFGEDIYSCLSIPPISSLGLEARMMDGEEGLFRAVYYVGKDKVAVYSNEFTINGCLIKEPDPDGYLLKICKYLRENEDRIIPNKKPNEYSIKEIEEGQYQGREVFKIWLDYKDLAYIDKETNEVIGFSPGDW